MGTRHGSSTMSVQRKKGRKAFGSAKEGTTRASSKMGKYWAKSGFLAKKDVGQENVERGLFRDSPGPCQVTPGTVDHDCRATRESIEPSELVCH